MASSGNTPISLYYSATAGNAPTAANLIAGELAINTNDGKLFYKDSAGVVQTLATKAATSGIFSGTGAITLPVGTTAQVPTGVTGMLRFNTTKTSFEGYNGTAWTSVGGATLSNDTTTATNLYPLFASITSGSATTVYTSDAKYLYKPSTGDLSASQVVASNGIVVNSKTVAASYTIATGNNAMSVGPVSVASGQSVNVSSGSRWVIL
jgi:hypothetical protein